MTAANGTEVRLVANPAMFNEQPVNVERAPEHGEHTETLLLEAGVPWDRIAAMKEAGAHPLDHRPPIRPSSRPPRPPPADQAIH